MSDETKAAPSVDITKLTATEEVSILGLKGTVKVPATVEDFNALGGNALNEAIKNVLYRSVFAVVRDEFTESLAKQSGIARKSKPGKARKDGKESEPVWDESEFEYFDRVVAETNSKPEDYQDLFNTVLASVSFDPKARERTAGKPKTVAKVYKTAAQNLIDGGNENKAATKLSGLLGRTVEPTLESLAEAIRDDQQRKDKEMAAQYATADESAD